MKPFDLPESAYLPIDEEEAQMMAEMEAGEWVPLPKEEEKYYRKLIQKAAKNTLAKKKKAINQLGKREEQNKNT
jgi:hypothetical protein